MSGGDDVGLSMSSSHQVYRGLSPTSSSRMENRIKELEEALEQERAAHFRTQKELDELHLYVQELQDKMETTEHDVSAQIEIVHRRDQELLKAKKDAELAITQSEANESLLKKRFQEQLNDLSEQLERANKAKSKVEKEKQSLVIEIEAVASQLETANKARDYAESKLDGMDDQLKRMKIQVDELTRSRDEMAGVRNKLTQENAELQRQVSALEANLDAFNKNKSQAQLKLESTQTKLEEEIRIHNQLQSQFSNLNDDFVRLHMELDEQTEANARLQAELQKAGADNQQLKAKHEKDITIITEELEDNKRKFGARLAELESQLDAAKSKAARLEKEKSKLTIEIENVMVNLDDANAALGDTSRRLKQAETGNSDLQRRVDELDRELQTASGDSRRFQEELIQLKKANEDLQAKVDALTRENNKLNEALRESESGNKDLTRQVQELTLIRSDLQGERDALHSELSEATDANRDLGARLDAANAALQQLKQEMENRLRDADEEIESLRKTSQRTIDELRANVVDLEGRLRNEASRLKSRYENERHELEMQVDVLGRNNAELTKSNKGLLAKLKETETSLENERRSLQESLDALAAAERKLVLLQSAVVDLEAQLIAAEKARKNAESELAESSSHVTEINITMQNLTNDKHRLEGDLAMLRQQLDDAATARRTAEERAERLGVEVARLTDQLRQEHDAATAADATRKKLETSLRELTVRLEEVESLGDGKKNVMRMQLRIDELEAELDMEQRRGRDSLAEIKKLQRQLADLRASSQSEHQLVIEYTETINSLEMKLLALRKQFEHSEEMLNITMGKYRKTQQLLEEAERRADRAGNVNVVRYSSTVIGGGGGGVGGFGGRGITRSRAMSVSRDTSTRRMSYY